jgi:hypothetical protein
VLEQTADDGFRGYQAMNPQFESLATRRDGVPAADGVGGLDRALQLQQ